MIVFIGPFHPGKNYSKLLGKHKDGKNKGKYKDSELYKIGSYVGHSFIKFKDTRKKWTTATVYNQGNTIPPTDPDLWMTFPPEKLLKTQFVYTLKSYFFYLE